MSNIDRSAPVYPIGVVQELTDLSGRQIRYYEKVGLITPTRSKGNQRLFSPDDVEVLLEIKELIASGLNVEGVRAHLERRKLPEPSTSQLGSTDHRREDAGQMDHEYVINQMRSGRKLTSLFPVDDQAELIRRLGSTSRPANEPGVKPE